jgi:hypothetical protein
MKKFGILIIVLSFTIPVFGQRGYYCTDTATLAGIDLTGSVTTNSYFCSVIKGDDVVRFFKFHTLFQL